MTRTCALPLPPSRPLARRSHRQARRGASHARNNKYRPNSGAFPGAVTRSGARAATRCARSSTRYHSCSLAAAGRRWSSRGAAAAAAAQWAGGNTAAAAAAAPAVAPAIRTATTPRPASPPRTWQPPKVCRGSSPTPSCRCTRARAREWALTPRCARSPRGPRGVLAAGLQRRRRRARAAAVRRVADVVRAARPRRPPLPLPPIATWQRPLVPLHAPRQRRHPRRRSTRVRWAVQACRAPLAA